MERKSIEQFWQGGQQQYIHMNACVIIITSIKNKYLFLYFISTFATFP